MQASRYCTQTKPYCISKVVVNIQITKDFYCLPWCISTNLQEIDTNRKPVTQPKENFTEHTNGNRQLPLKMKRERQFQKLNHHNLNKDFTFKNLQGLPTNTCYEEELKVLIYMNHKCLKTGLPSFCKTDKMTTSQFRNCLNAYRYQSELEKQMGRYTEQNFCYISYMVLQKIQKIGIWNKIY